MKIYKDLIKHLIEESKTNPHIKKCCDEFIEKKQKEAMLNPSVYLLKVKKHNGDKTYLNVRSFLPISLDVIKELRSYVGVADNFPNGVKDKTAILMGQESMRKRIKKFIEKKHNDTNN